MSTLARSVECGAFQMKAEHAGNLQAGLSSCSQLLDDLASVGDQGWQATRGPCFAVRLDDASYPSFGWLVIEKNATTSVDLDVDESGCKDRICRKADCARFCRAEGDAFYSAIRNPDGR